MTDPTTTPTTGHRNPGYRPKTPRTPSTPGPSYQGAAWTNGRSRWSRPEGASTVHPPQRGIPGAEAHPINAGPVGSGIATPRPRYTPTEMVARTSGLGTAEKPGTYVTQGEGYVDPAKVAAVRAVRARNGLTG